MKAMDDSPLLPQDSFPPPTAESACLEADSSASLYSIEAWIVETKAANLPLSQTTRKRHRSLSPVSLSLHRDQALWKKPRRNSFSEREGEMAPKDAFATPVNPKRIHFNAGQQVTPLPTTPSIPETPPDADKKIRNTRWIGERMDQHDIVMDHEGNIKEHAEIISIINHIVDDPRGSAMKPESAQRIIDRQQYYKNLNEDTILNELLPLISKKDYMKEIGLKTGGNNSGEAANQYILEEWFDTGIATASNCNLLDAYMPSKYDDMDFHQLLKDRLKKDDKMTTPRPDRCLGIRSDKFAAGEGKVLDINIKEAIGICPAMDHPFMIIEGKSNLGDLGQAENQARRGGAVLVNAHRALRNTAKQSTNKAGADIHTIVFSAVMDANVVNLYIHWAENKPQNATTVFHMTSFRSVGLKDKRTLPALRQSLNNINHMCAIERMPELVELREKLWQVSMNRLMERDAQVGRKRKDAPSSS